MCVVGPAHSGCSGSYQPSGKHEINGAALALMDVLEFATSEDVVSEHEQELQQARIVLLAQRKHLMVGSGGAGSGGVRSGGVLPC